MNSQTSLTIRSDIPRLFLSTIFSRGIDLWHGKISRIPVRVHTNWLKNVQQINETGHHIGAFIGTALVLLLFTFGLWLLSAMLVAIRSHLTEKYNAQSGTTYRNRTLLESLFLVGRASVRRS
jgi:hypothetical protein